MIWTARGLRTDWIRNSGLLLLQLSMEARLQYKTELYEHSLYPSCTPTVPFLYPSCTPTVPYCTLLYPSCTLPVPILYPSCTPPIPLNFPKYSLPLYIVHNYILNDYVNWDSFFISSHAENVSSSLSTVWQTWCVQPEFSSWNCPWLNWAKTSMTLKRG